MSCTVETKTGRPIRSEVAYAGDYGSRLEGYIQGYKDECKITFEGSSLTMNSGVIILHGKRIIVDEGGTSLGLPTEDSGPVTYFLFLKIDMESGDGYLDYSESTNPPGFSQDDLFLNPETGIHWLEVGKFVNSTTGITDVTNTLKPMTGVTELFSGVAAVGQTIDLKYPLDVLKSAKHIDMKMAQLNIKMQGVVAYNNTSIFFSANYPAGEGSNAGSGIPMCELQLVSGTNWRVAKTLLTYTNGTANVSGRDIESVEVQF